MVLYLDPTTRTFVCVYPDGVPLKPPHSQMNLTPFQITDDQWPQTYYPAFDSAFKAGQDLVVNADGTTKAVAHTQTPQEQAVAALQAFKGNAAPQLPDVIATLKALITVQGH